MLVTNKPGSPGGAIGVVTLEDVVEELISQEIIDETDQYIDSRRCAPLLRSRSSD
jgi:metal transporter CNNM